MQTYDPFQPPDPQEWLALDESERIDLIEEYHRESGDLNVPNLRLHAAIHSIVESQAAEGNQLAVARTLARLQAEGLDRHEAIHAIGSVLIEQFYYLAEEMVAPEDAQKAYEEALESLTAEDWENSY